MHRYVQELPEEVESKIWKKLITLPQCVELLFYQVKSFTLCKHYLIYIKFQKDISSSGSYSVAECEIVVTIFVEENSQFMGIYFPCDSFKLSDFEHVCPADLVAKFHGKSCSICAILMILHTDVC